MKTILLSLVIIGLALCAMPAVAAPYSVDLTAVNAATNVANFNVTIPVQPVNLTLWNVPAPLTDSTVNVARVHGTYSSTLWSAVIASNTTSTSTVLTNAIWLVPGDVIRVTGPTNFSFEVNGNQ